MLLAISAAVFPALMIVAAVGDVLSRRIPNILVLCTAVLFFPLALAHGLPLAAVLVHVAAAVVLLAAGYFMFSLGYLGGGDAKLMAAAGLWLGFEGMVPFMALTVLAGGGLALIILAWFFIHHRTLMWSPGLSTRFAGVKPSIPYGFAVAAGAILTLPGSWLFPGLTAGTWLTQI